MNEISKVKFFKTILAIVEILGLWWIFCIALNKDVLPSPYESLVAMIGLISSGDILVHLVSSFNRVVIGSVIGIVFAIPSGMILGYNKTLEGLFGSAFDLLYTIPKVIFLPIIIVLFGIGNLPKIFLISTVLYFQQTVVIRDRIKKLPPNMNNTIKIMGAGWYETVKYLLLPYCLPDVMTSLRSSLGTSIAMLFIIENFASVDGLGYYISMMMDQRNYSEMYGAIIILALMGWGIYYIIEIIERKICKWRYVVN